MNKRMKDCCKHDKTARQCKRMSDGKSSTSIYTQKCANPRGLQCAVRVLHIRIIFVMAVVVVAVKKKNKKVREKGTNDQEG